MAFSVSEVCVCVCSETMQHVLDLGIKMNHGLTWIINVFIFLMLLKDILQRGVNVLP